MKKIIIIIIITTLIILTIWTSLAVYAKKQKASNQLEEKVSQELIYLNQYFVTMLGEFNGLTIGDNRLQETEPKIQTNINTNLSDQSDNNSKKNDKIENKTDTVQNGILKNEGKYETKWEKLQTQIEQIYQVWNTVSIDLYALNIDSSSITSFNDVLNKATQEIKDKNKVNAMNAITSMHSKILDYKKSYDKDTRNLEILTIQNKAVIAYTDITNDRWNEANSKLLEAESIFSNLLNTLTSDYTNQATTNQCYILINELKKATKLKDKEIFYIEYRNLMSKMEILVK